MAIPRKQDSTILTGGDLSIGAAQAPGRAAAQAGAEQRSIGQGLVNLSQKFIQEAMPAKQTAQYANALSKATLAFQQRAQERLGQVADEDGNPLFETLPSDIASIAQEVQQEFGASIGDSEAREKFNEAFLRYATNQQIKSLSTARQQQLAFQRESVNTSVDSFAQQAATGDDADVLFANGEVRSILDSAVASGAITPTERANQLENYRKRVNRFKYDTLIEQNPLNTLSVLQENDHTTLGLTPEEKAHFVEQAVGAVSDVHNQKITQQKAEAAAVKDQQDTVYKLLLEPAKRGELGLKEIEANKGVIGELNYQKLLTTYQKANKKAQKSLDLRTKISDAIQRGDALSVEFSRSQINDHYKQTIAAASNQIGPDGNKIGALDLNGKAHLAVHYKAPVSAFTEELELSISQGPLENAEQSIKAYQVVNDNNPKVIENMRKTDRAIAALAEHFVENAGQSYDFALQLARESVLDSTDEMKQERRVEFKDLKEFKGDNIKETALEALGGTRGLNAKLEAGTAARFKRTAEEFYIISGNKEAAIKNASAGLRASHAETSLNGGRVLMFNAPEVFGLDSGEAQELLINDLIESGIVESATPFGLEDNEALRQTLGPLTPRDPDVDNSDLTNRFHVQYFDARVNADGEQILVYDIIDQETGNFIEDPAKAGRKQWVVNVTKELQKRNNPERVEQEAAEARALRQQSLDEQQVTEPNAGDFFLPKSMQKRALDKSLPTDEKSLQQKDSRIKSLNKDANNNVATDQVTGIGIKSSKGLERVIKQSPTSHLQLAEAFLGQSEHTHADTLSAFFKGSLGKNINPKHTPWCAAFVNGILQSSGVKGTNSLAAKSFLQWGTPTDKPSKGDVVVFDRTSNPAYGHVGFYVGEDANNILVLGGNQSDSVSVQKYPKSRLRGFRRPPKATDIRKYLQ